MLSEAAGTPVTSKFSVAPTVRGELLVAEAPLSWMMVRFCPLSEPTVAGFEAITRMRSASEYGVLAGIVPLMVPPLVPVSVPTVPSTVPSESSSCAVKTLPATKAPPPTVKGTEIGAPAQ